jgi:hypothetical protein
VQASQAAKSSYKLVKSLKKRYVQNGYIAKYNLVKELLDQVLQDYPEGVNAFSASYYNQFSL